MSPQKEKYYRFLFLTSAIYDWVLGLVFTFFQTPAFARMGIADKLPQFGGYITLLGAFVFVIGVAYFLIFRGDLRQNRDLILVGTLYKLAYCAVAFYYFLTGPVPHLVFVVLFGVVDLIFFVLMAQCWLFLRKAAQS